MAEKIALIQNVTLSKPLTFIDLTEEKAKRNGRVKSQGR